MKINRMGRIAALGACAGALVMAATPASAEKIANSYICVFKPSMVSKGAVKARAEQAANAQGGKVKHLYTTAIRGFSANISAQGAAQMKARNPHIAYCEQDQVASISKGKPTNPGGGGGDDGGTASQETPWGIARVNGGVDMSTSGKRAFVIDSGIDGSHPDLNVDTTLSVNFSKGNSWDDGNGHGTHVAGTIGAIDNGYGVIGVAAGVQVVAVRVLDNRGSGSYSDVIAGVDYVAANGNEGDVANMSLGGPPSTALDDAVVAAAATGVSFTLAAGNSSDDAGNYSPARAEGANIYTVSAFANGDTWASFSNYGDDVDWAEPGVSVKSTYKGDSYATLDGTSMAAPHLAGVLLLGNVSSGGTVAGDPDGVADKIGVH